MDSFFICALSIFLIIDYGLSLDTSSDQRGTVEKVNSFNSDSQDEVPDTESYNNMRNAKHFANQYAAELAMGDMTELFGTNNHYMQPVVYKDFGRRFVPQYPYYDAADNQRHKTHEDKLMPKLAPPELVLAIANKSALIEDSKPLKTSDDDIQRKDILRTGDYWNAIWREDVEPESVLRSSKKTNKALETILARIMPGTNLYKLVSTLKKLSPKLIYIINKVDRK